MAIVYVPRRRKRTFVNICMHIYAEKLSSVLIGEQEGTSRIIKEEEENKKERK